MPEFCKCGRPAEWAGEYCQDCWEYHCFERFWEQIENLIKEGADNDTH